MRFSNFFLLLALIVFTPPLFSESLLTIRECGDVSNASKVALEYIKIGDSIGTSPFGYFSEATWKGIRKEFETHNEKKLKARFKKSINTLLSISDSFNNPRDLRFTCTLEGPILMHITKQNGFDSNWTEVASKLMVEESGGWKYFLGTYTSSISLFEREKHLDGVLNLLNTEENQHLNNLMKN